jgi:hypothetical protein
MSYDDKTYRNKINSIFNFLIRQMVKRDQQKSTNTYIWGPREYHISIWKFKVQFLWSKYDEYHYSTQNILSVSEFDPRILSKKEQLYVSVYVSATSVCIRSVFIPNSIHWFGLLPTRPALRTTLFLIDRYDPHHSDAKVFSTLVRPLPLWCRIAIKYNEG